MRNLNTQHIGKCKKLQHVFATRPQPQQPIEQMLPMA